jgi:hypothetical protein
MNLTDSSELATQFPGRANVGPNVAVGDGSEAAFAFLYAEALEAARDQYPGFGGSVDNDFGLLATDDYGGPRAASKPIPGKADAASEETWQSLLLGYSRLIALGSGARERQFNDQDNQPESPQDLGGTSSLSYPAPVPGPDGNAENSAPVVHKSQLAEWMDTHALTRSSHHCAMYCRRGMEAAGLSTQDRPRSGDAADYGPFLRRHGAQVLSPDSYTPQVGDTVVFDKTAQHPSGHIEVYDGQRWVSDFMQHSFSPYRDAASTPPFTIYRLT